MGIMKHSSSNPLKFTRTAQMPLLLYIDSNTPRSNLCVLCMFIEIYMELDIYSMSHWPTRFTARTLSIGRFSAKLKLCSVEGGGSRREILNMVSDFKHLF